LADFQSLENKLKNGNNFGNLFRKNKLIFYLNI